MGEFQTIGASLLQHGYLILPILAGQKRPALSSWQNARLTLNDLKTYPTAGLGLLCGQGAQPLCALDVDTTDAGLAQRFSDWCQRILGAACERVGLAPKTLLVYRAEAAGWSKLTSSWFEDIAGGRHRLELLGKGQQFVAYHTHPATGRPYEWVDVLGGLQAVGADHTTVISALQAQVAVDMFEALALEAGLERVGPATGAQALNGHGPQAGDPLLDYQPPLGLPLSDLKGYLAGADNTSYESWLKVGMSLHHECEGSEAALDAWDDWSSSAPNYQGREDLALRWGSFGLNGHAPVTAKWLVKAGRERQATALADARKRTRDEALAAINSCTEPTQLIPEVAVRVGALLQGDPALRTELAGVLAKQFKKLTGVPLGLKAAKVALAPPSRSAGASLTGGRYERTEFGNLDRMLDRYGDGLMFVPEISRWYRWSGVRWLTTEPQHLKHLVDEVVRALPEEIQRAASDEERSELACFYVQSQTARMVGAVVTLAEASPRIMVPVGELDKEMRYFGVANGAVDLVSGLLLAPDPKLRLTVVSDIAYVPDAPRVLWEQTLREVFFDDLDLVAFWKRLIGYTLLGNPKEDILVIPFGNGCNGKSTVLGVIQAVLGAHARMVPAETFLTRNLGAGDQGGRPREDILRMRGARLVYCAEPEEGSELRAGLVKSMTGGESMPARGINSRTTVEVKPTWVAFVPTNHRPVVKGDDVGVWRRLLPVPFTRNFEADPVCVKDVDRGERLAAELEGVLAWCVEGALEYQKVGLCVPPSVRAACGEYREDMDLLAEWLETCCDVSDVSVKEHNSRLWASWEDFARGRGELAYIRSSRALGRKLGSKFKGWRTGSERGFFGVRVRELA